MYINESVINSRTDTYTDIAENSYIFYEEGTVKILNSKKGTVKEYVFLYDKENQTLTIDKNTYNIEELTQTTLVYSFTSYYFAGNNEAGIIWGTSIQTYYFEKVK